MGETDLSLDLFREALKSDYVDIQRGTTKEGIHVGVMAGTAVLATKAYAGLDLSGELLKIKPRLPDDWRRIKFNISIKDDRYFIEVTRDIVRLKAETENEKAKQVLVNQQRISLTPQEWVAINYSDTISN
jgi:trehalose/maltose hydrolase-like predicted phosphorylase